MVEPQTPDWVRDAVFYQIFPDRFAKSASVTKPSGLQPWGSAPTPHGYQGGDLIGVAERLDYLTDLGINALYFTPIFQSASNHRYHTHDYERVDPMLGGNDALRTLLDRAHNLDIRIVLDGVFNHASRGFFAFHDILENGPQSAYLDWFTVHSYPLKAYDSDHPPGYEAWWNLPALPKFNIKTPAVRQYLLGIAERWVQFGIDGWRLDVPNEIRDDSFWREFRRVVRQANDQTYIVGEIWGEARHWLQGDMWDAVMNYLFSRAAIAFFIGTGVHVDQLRKTSLHPAGPPGAEAFDEAIQRMLDLYHPNITAAQLNLLGSHDTPRFLTLARGDTSALRLATLFQMSFVGAPCIYYGDEIGLAGGHDPECRGAFPWNEQAWDTALRDDIKAMIAIRRARPALRRGRYATLLAQGDLFALHRHHEQDHVVVAFNTSEHVEMVDLKAPSGLSEGDALQVIYGEKLGQSRLIEGGHLRALRVPPRSGLILATPMPD